MFGKGLSRKNKNLIFYILMIAIPLIQFLIFYVYVNINSVIMAFQKYIIDKETSTGFFIWNGIENFKSVFFRFQTNGTLLTALKNTMLSFACTLVAGIGLSMIFSYYIAKKMPLSSTFRFLLFLPSMISSVVVVLLFRYFSEDILKEFINKIFKANLSGLLFGAPLNISLATILLFNLFTGFGTMILMFSGAMSQIDESIVEAAMLDGISPIKEFFLIYIPMIYPTMVTFIIVNIAGMFSNQMGLYSFYGAEAENGLQTIGYWLFSEITSGDAPTIKYPELSAAGVLLTCVATPLTMIVRRLLEKFGPSVE